MKIMNFSKTVLKNLFSRPSTRLYPKVTRPAFERTRGHIEISIEDCIHCGICSKKCPTGAITVSRDPKTWSIERFNCIQCNSCVENCPKKCLSMKNQYTSPEREKTKDVFTHA